MNMYKAIIFDLDNTLLNYTLSELDSMKRTCSDHALFGDDETQWSSFWETFLKHNYAHWMDFVNQGSVKSIEDVLRFSFRDTLNADVALHNQLTSTYWNYFCNTCHFESGAEEVLSVVQSKYRLGIISNGISEAQKKRLAAGNIQSLFQSVVVSDEVGIRKPKKEIFDIALQELRVDYGEVLFVGDSLQDDYHGALNAGIDFCFYNRNQIELPTSITPKYSIARMQDLLSVGGL
ncbi:HAD family hydrolase [Cohnella lupini]|uniref:Putative hydrolase of the HAD superfamily n=1 Tax=Cohnella lupini TaxID=1294267 RepID=A0A3D9IBN2_9BACL|nr:HAD-IA family hydrolase [Cohnella lupini]RED59194.1 putative hydrolase of the HAD superfamily [Cohnella lupini]